MNVPLPAGWSAQYDQNQRRYFFINHITKKTTWEDPRFSQRPEQPTSAAFGDDEEFDIQKVKAKFPKVSDHAIRSCLRQHQGDVEKCIRDLLLAGHELVTDSNNGPQSTTPKRALGSPEKKARLSDVDHLFGQQHRRPEPLTIPVDDDNTNLLLITDHVDDTKVKELKVMFPTCSDSYIHEVLSKNMGMVGMSVTDIEHAGYTKAGEGRHVKANMFLSRKLRAEFPQMDREVIDEVLSACKNNESTARSKLAVMGRADGPSHHTTGPTSPAQQTESHTSHMSSADKHKLLVQLCGDFQGSSQMVVEMVLETVGYVEENARSVLRTMGTEVKGHRKSVQSKASDNSHSTSPQKSSSKAGTPHKSSKTSTPKKGSKASASGSGARGSVSHDDDGKDSISVGEKSRLYNAISLLFPQYSRTIIETALQTCDYDEQRTKNLLLRDTAPPPTSPRKSVTTSPPKTTTESSPSSKTSVKSSPPEAVEPPQWASFHGSIAKGPNPSLHMGPDPANLLTDYVQVRGPDATLYHGPNPANVHGPSHALGPDKNLRCGAQTGLRRGPSSDNLSQNGACVSV